MRRLLYVPIIHDEADLGHAGKALGRLSAALSGEQRWAMHEETARRFWENMAAYLRSLSPGRLRVYQDGLAAGGEMARRIVEEAAKRGSKNYQLVQELLEGGAEVRKTEDPALLWRERSVLLRSLEREGTGGGPPNTEASQAERDDLMAARDRFIADTINTTLHEGEVGVLFIGADHDLASLLAGDIAVEPVKDPGMVRAYFGELFAGRDGQRLEELCQYVRSPVPEYPEGTCLS
ncbi:MAG: hypothetical protein Q8Q52_08590 [Acidimicrobiia bacterium]|nr:hypothetical protein [Acidimicrobiia bacterium]